MSRREQPGRERVGLPSGRGSCTARGEPRGGEWPGSLEEGTETCVAGAEKDEGDVEKSARRSGQVSEAAGEVLAFFLRAMEIRGRGF